MLKSFSFAFNGLKEAFKSELNLKIHVIASILVILFACFLNFSSMEFAILFIIIFLVIILELVNTVVEKLVNQHSTEISDEARIIKDISASVVLMSAILSIIIGVLLFLNKLW